MWRASCIDYYWFRTLFAIGRVRGTKAQLLLPWPCGGLDDRTGKEGVVFVFSLLIHMWGFLTSRSTEGWLLFIYFCLITIFHFLSCRFHFQANPTTAHTCADWRLRFSLSFGRDEARKSADSDLETTMHGKMLSVLKIKHITILSHDLSPENW